MATIWKWLKRIALVIIVVIVAAVAYSFISSRAAGPTPDAANVSDMRSLNTALHSYHSAYGHFPDTLEAMKVPASGPSTESAAGLISSRLAGGKAHGYRYTYQKTAQGYAIHGDPDGADSDVHLFTDETSEVRVRRKQPAEKSSAPLRY